MENIIGINEARPKLTALVESLEKGQKPYIITSKSEPKAVLLSYKDYRALREVYEDRQRLFVKLALAELGRRAMETGLTEEAAAREVKAYRTEAGSS